MSAPWFHVNGLPERVGEGAPPAEVALDAEEARHAGGARRLAVGASIVLFDGEGRTARAELTALDRRGARARLIEIATHPLPSPAVHLASALPKGDRQTVLLAMTCQLGLRSFTPLECERSVARSSAGSAARWERVLRESCKQSHRAHVPSLQPPCQPAGFVAGVAEHMPVWLLHPEPAAEPGTPTPTDRAAAPAEVALLVGPEGGFVEAEIAACEAAGARRISLGEGILRTETAAVAGVTLLRHGWKIAPGR